MHNFRIRFSKIVEDSTCVRLLAKLSKQVAKTTKYRLNKISLRCANVLNRTRPYKRPAWEDGTRNATLKTEKALHSSPHTL